MAAQGGRKRVGRGPGKGGPPAVAHGIRLADGVKLVASGRKDRVPMLIHAAGEVQLNEGAVAILQLCDGSRSLEQIVSEIAQRSADGALADDIAAFLAAARARGWIVEVAPDERSSS
jgi:coenzyme PQQ biosynthesis protein PqqD